MGSWKSQYAFPFNCEMAGTALLERSWVELLCLFRRVLPSVTGIIDAWRQGQTVWVEIRVWLTQNSNMCSNVNNT